MPEAFAWSLLALFAFSFVLRRQAMLITTALLAWNWGLCVLLSHVDGTGLSWFALFWIDLGTAALLLLAYRERWQIGVAALFVPMIAAHAGFGVHHDPYAYLLVLSWLSWAQVFMVAARGVTDVVERLGRNRDAERRLVADRAHPPSTARWRL